MSEHTKRYSTWKWILIAIFLIAASQYIKRKIENHIDEVYDLIEVKFCELDEKIDEIKSSIDDIQSSVDDIKFKFNI